MQGLAQFWRQMTTRPVRQAFGLAPQGQAWALVGLSRLGRDVVRVQASTVVRPPDPLADGQQHVRVWQQALATLLQAPARPGQHAAPPESGRSHGLLQRAFQRRDQQLQLAWPAERMVIGQTEFPPDWPDDDCTAEVQLAVAQALQRDPDEVNFDWQEQPSDDGLSRQVAWVGCAQDELAEFRRHIRAARWQLGCVEPEMQAAQRAARALQGGLSSLLTRPAQDWQFWLSDDPPKSVSFGQDPDNSSDSPVMQQALLSPAGPWLVACGLALKAWQ